MTKARILQISTGDRGIYLTFNTKKPWWKKKEYFYIGPNSETIFDLQQDEIDLERLYFKYEDDRGPNNDKVIPFKEYPWYDAL